MIIFLTVIMTFAMVHVSLIALTHAPCEGHQTTHQTAHFYLYGQKPFQIER